MLETLDQNRVNIKDITLDEPQILPQLPFDFDHALDDNDWENITESVNRLGDTWNHNIPPKAALRMAFPEKAFEKKNWPKQSEWAEGRKELDQHKKADRWNEFASLAASMKILAPRVLSNFPKDPRVWSKMERSLDLTPGSSLTPDILFSLAFNLKILRPNYEPRFPVLMELLKVADDDLIYHRNNNLWMQFARTACQIKAVIPKETYTPEVTAEDWINLRANFKDQKDSNRWDGLIYALRDLRILAADQIRFTPNGLELTMPETPSSFSEQNLPLPETRRF